MTTRVVDCNGLLNERILAKLHETIPDREKTVLGEGDSWFAINTPFDVYPQNILHTLNLQRRTGIIDVSHSGDKATQMASGAQYQHLTDIITGTPAIKLDAMLLSAGGNDVIEKVEQVIGDYIGRVLKNGERHLNIAQVAILQRIIDEKVVEVFEDIKSSVRKMCDLRSGPNASIPVIIHGYAYITPREAPARLFSWGEGVRGPWLKKKLDDLSIHDPAVQKTLAVRVIDRMNEFYRTQIAEPVIDGVHYVDLRPLVIEAQLEELKPTPNWNDEIHSGKASLQKIATQAYAPLLDEWFQ